MNNALIAIAGSIAELSEPGLAIARGLGKVQVDHGETSCETPEAAPYIERMLARGKARPTASRTSAAKRSKPAIPEGPAKRKAPERGAVKPAQPGRVLVENVNAPKWRQYVDAAKYSAMKRALVKALPRREPGLTQREMMEAVKPHLPEDLFPGGAKSGWWVKCVQLDLEAKGALTRQTTKPLRWHRGRARPRV